MLHRILLLLIALSICACPSNDPPAPAESAPPAAPPAATAEPTPAPAESAPPAATAEPTPVAEEPAAPAAAQPVATRPQETAVRPQRPVAGTVVAAKPQLQFDALTAAKDKPAAEEPPKGTRYASPFDVFEAATQFRRDQDWDSYAKCLTMDSRDELAGYFYLKSAFIIGLSKDKALAAALRKVVEEHAPKEPMEKINLADAKSDDETRKLYIKIGASLKDRAGFIDDVLKLLAKDASASSFSYGGKLKNVTVDGDNGVGTIVRRKAGKEVEEKIRFRKSEAGGWKIRFSTTAWAKDSDSRWLP